MIVAPTPRFLALCLSMLLLAGLLISAAPAAGAEWRPPNVVVILVDDAGLMDFGAYGGEARTPHIDALADAGVMFSNYHTSPLCAPSRAMLLTGLDNHLTGVATIPEVLIDSQRDQDGYRMALAPGVETVAARLQRAGYRTYMTGKWHLGSGPGDLPVDHGFDRSFALDASGADNWEQKSYMPYYDEAPWFEDGAPADLPEDFYSSAFIVDRMIDYLRAGDSAQPFFAYLAFQAIHIPIQAPREFIDRYDGVYDGGWDELRKQRWRRAQTLGLIPSGAELGPMHPTLRRWEALSDDEQKLYSRSMAVNAGMLDAMDHHIGRLIAYLREQEAFANTLFVVTSDNGPEFNDPVNASGMGLWMWMNGYHHDLERLGERGSLAFIGPEWASAAASPGSLFKFYASEGGLRVPLIVSGPGVGALGLVGARSFVTDLAPTILDLAEADPTEREGLSGRSLRDVLDSTSLEVYGPEEAVAIEVSGNAALFQGDYKLVRNTLPHGDGQWRLYFLKGDPGETRDMAEALPARFEALKAAYANYAGRVGVIAPPDGFNPLEALRANTLARQRGVSLPLTLAVILLLGLGGALLLWRRRSGR
ncbi:MAG: arylsulfatase [Pseudomonadota bacterium]